MTMMARLQLQDECPRVGTGFKTFILLPTRGKKLVRLLYWSTLTVVRMTRQNYNRNLISEGSVPPKVMTMIKKKAKIYRRLGVPFPQKIVRKLLNGSA